MKPQKFNIFLITVFLLTSSIAWGVRSYDKGYKQESTSSSYVEYSLEAFAQAKDQKRILFFYASWCPSCRASTKVLIAASLPSNVKIFEVDYDNSSDLKKKYGVTRQDTFVQVDQDGNKITEWSGNAKNILKQLK